MSAREDGLDLALRGVDGARACCLDDDLGDRAAAGDGVADRGYRGDRDVVLILDAVCSLRLEHADDAVARAVELDRLVERVLAAEEVGRDGLADHDHALVGS